jgi:CubicO group peptidase (beta-lactamase class C family)
MKTVKSYFLRGAALLLWTPAIAFAQGATDTLTKKLDEILAASDFPGFVVAVTHAEKTVYARGFGFSNRAEKIAYTIDTIQPVGSVSKTVIGLALMKAVEAGGLTLDADINEYLPFPIQNPHRPKERITLRHLATHTSGLIDEPETYANTYSATAVSSTPMGDFLREYYATSGKHYKKSNFANTAPGTHYAYSNIASALVAYIVELRTKIAFDAFTEKEIFAPLGMSASHWHARDTLASRYATLYEIHKENSLALRPLLNKDGSLKPYSTITYPDGGLRTSASDLIKYVKAMVNSSAPEYSKILAPELFSQLFRKQFSSTNMPEKMDRREPNRALFWAFSRNENLRHTGSDPGVFAFISFHPQTKIGRVFMLNAQLDGEDNEKAIKAFTAIIAALDAFESTL